MRTEWKITLTTTADLLSIEKKKIYTIDEKNCFKKFLHVLLLFPVVSSLHYIDKSLRKLSNCLTY